MLVLRAERRAHCSCRHAALVETTYMTLQVMLIFIDRTRESALSGVQEVSFGGHLGKGF